MVIKNAVAVTVVLSMGIIYGVDSEKITGWKQEIKKEQRSRVCKLLGHDCKTAIYDRAKKKPKVVVSIGGDLQSIPLVRTSPGIIPQKNILKQIKANQSYPTTR